jgi:phage gpG-like protein
MPVDISIEIFGQEQVKRTIMRPSQRADDARPAFRTILEMLRETERRRFRAQGPGWEPLKEETLRRKRAHGERLQILMATDELFESLTSPGSPVGIAEIDKNSLRYGTHREWAASHQFGAPGANIPQRTIIDLDEPFKRDAVKVLQGFILTGKVG